jgi:uncharacterized protein (TIGR03118 family)
MPTSRSIRMLAIAASGALAAGTIGVAVPAGAATNAFTVKFLVTDKTGAPTKDKDLVNAWGMSQGPSTPVWVSDNGSGKSTLYQDSGNHKVPLTVTIPGGDPTGQVYNSFNGFKAGGSPSSFIFDTESGVLSGWSAGSAAVKVKTVQGAIFKGLAIANVNGKPRLYATDFHNGKVDVFTSSWTMVKSSTAFRDSKIPHGYAPFGVAALAGNIYVTYAKQDSDKHDDVSGSGHGFVDVYSATGALMKRLISRGALDSPWGLAIAPSGWGPFGGDLLVGNFGNGWINAYSPMTGAKKGTLHDSSGYAIVLPGLWGLLFGNGTSAATDALMFTSGPGGEAHGRWGTITSS